MARVSVLYFGGLREIVGKRSEEVTVGDSSSVYELARTLAQKHGALFREFVFGPNGRVRKSLAFAVNGQSIRDMDIGKIKCKDVREFVILPPISGG